MINHASQSTRFSLILLSIFLLLAGLLVVGFDDQNQLFDPTEQAVALDVGQGDAILLQTKKSEQILIDGGPNNSVLTGLGSHMPFYDRTIEMIILTHPDADHVTGLVEVLRRYTVERVVATGVVHTLPAYEAFWSEVYENNTTVIQPLAGDSFNYTDLSIQVLWPDQYLWNTTSPYELNDTSVVVRAEYENGFSILLTGDLTKNKENALLDRYGSQLQSTALKAGHHGSKTSTGPEFVAQVSPQIAVISAGCDNPYGHPHDQVVQTLLFLEVQILSTCDDGDIVFDSW